MQYASQVVYKAFLEHRAPQKKAKYLSFLSPELSSDMLSLPKLKLPKASDFSDQKLLERVHYSWFLPTLKLYSKKEIALFLSALPEKIRSFLQNTLGIKKVKNTGSLATLFLQKHLIASLLGEKEWLLPPEYFPSSLATTLARLSKQHLVELVCYLGLYDLAFEIKYIVDPKLLRYLFQTLSSSQRAFLKKIIPQQEGERFPFTAWDKSEKQLTQYLQRKGLSRLSAFLSQEKEDLLWYIAHTLDIGRGSFLLKIYEKKMTSKVSPAIIRSVTEALSYMSL